MTMTAGLMETAPGLVLPRFGTPRDLERPTLGAEVTDIAKRLGKPLMPWQQHVADVALEYDPVTGKFFYDEVDLTVPRQSGKTTIVMAKSVWRMTKMARRYGPQRSTYTAQKRDSARRKLERDFAPLLRASRQFPEVEHARAKPKRPTEWRLQLNNGAECIHFGGDSYWQIDTPSGEAGHGDTLDDGTIDEAFAHQDDEVEGAMRPAQLTRRNAQLWVLSTAGTGKSFYLWRKILAGRAACESGHHGTVAYFEWSAPDDADPGDPEVWRDCSPARGYTINDEAIAATWERAQRTGQEGIDTFRRSMLNQWPEIPVLEEEKLDRVIDADLWARAEHDGAKIEGPARIGLEIAEDRSWSAFGAVGQSSKAGRVHGEVIRYAEGTGWVIPAAVALHDRWGEAVVVAAGSAAAVLVPDLNAAGVPTTVLNASEQAQACGLTMDRLQNDQFAHTGQGELDYAVRNAGRRNVGDGTWVVARRKSTAEISPLLAVMWAGWMFAAGPKPVDLLSQIFGDEDDDEDDWED